MDFFMRNCPICNIEIKYKTKQSFDNAIKRNSKCSQNEHDKYRKCQILNNKELCDVCCDWDSQSIDFLPFVEKITGKKLTSKEVEEICSNCYKKDWGRPDID